VTMSCIFYWTLGVRAVGFRPMTPYFVTHGDGARLLPERKGPSTLFILPKHRTGSDSIARPRNPVDAVGFTRPLPQNLSRSVPILDAVGRVLC
jgi:hypothetical protein